MSVSRETLLRLLEALTEMILEEATGNGQCPRPPTHAPPPPPTVDPTPSPSQPPQLVTLQQMAGWCHRSKRTLKDYLDDLPPPFIEGGSGRAAFWIWTEVRPVLQKLFHLQLPERLPDIHRP